MSLTNGRTSTEDGEEENVLVPSSQQESDNVHRPAKRRRVNGLRDSPSSLADSEDPNYDLPSNDTNETEEEGRKQSKNERFMHVPQHATGEEITYVTQVEQPDSSPSRIRGPRWRKKSPNIRPDPTPRPPPTPSHIGTSSKQISIPSDGEFDDDDPDLVQALQTSFGEVRMTTKPLAQTAAGSFRQTTLFGTGSVEKSTQSAQTKSHKWPLANRQEVATHHALNNDALANWVYPTNLGRTRDYQFNITSRALFHNLLVALPTGLGKTFIAATVMLNWYRWTRSAQIIFVAPTKPLVAQQVDACFNIAGIPRTQTTMLVGNVQPALRKEEWESKRVFFMTPQTLINDLKNGICDPKRIVLLVVDEAHRAKGGYAYVEVVKFIRRFNSSFRVLALTATPGSTVEGVQDVIDGLDIARVEIRTEQSLDIRDFVHLRNIDPIVLENSDEITSTLELFSIAVKPVMNKLTAQNAYWNKDPLSITNYGLIKARADWSKSAGRQADAGVKGMVNSIFTLLMKIATPLEKLKYHGIGVFYHLMKEFETEVSKGTSANAKAITSNEHWRKMMNRLQAWGNNPDFESHPKMTYLRDTLLNHFMDAEQRKEDTRIMVFTHYRDSAEEISRILNRHKPMVRAHVFVGQAASKASEGMDQKKQQEVVSKFKKGEYNTLVATSIGEEGLDIGEVDLIVCYDSNKSPIRMLQRMGRTGRKRAGNIVLLLMKGKEEKDFESAEDNYIKMQQMIASGTRFTFHEDRNMRIVPKGVVPGVDKRIVEIPVENTQVERGWMPEPKKGNRKLKRPEKKWNMPDGVETGFQFLGDGATRIPKATKSSKQPLGPYAALDQTVATLPSLHEVILTPEEELCLETRYAQVAGSEPQFVQIPQLNRVPSKLRKLARLKLVRHGVATKRVVQAFKAMTNSGKDWTRPTVPPTFDSDVEGASSDHSSRSTATFLQGKHAKRTTKATIKTNTVQVAKAHSKALQSSSRTAQHLNRPLESDPNEYDHHDSFIDDEPQSDTELLGTNSSEDELQALISRNKNPGHGRTDRHERNLSQRSRVSTDADLDDVLLDLSQIVGTSHRSASDGHGPRTVVRPGKSKNSKQSTGRNKRSKRVLSDSDE